MRSERGFTLSELLVSLTILGIVFSGLMYNFTSSSQNSRDYSIRVATHVKAQAIVRSVVSELRVLGSGVPFDQPRFEIGEVSLSDSSVSDPILAASCTANQIAFRLNESGNVAVLASNFDPSASSDVQVSDVSNINVDDPIYISNGVLGGEDGLSGVVSAVNTGTNTVTLASGVVASPGAIFPVGSVMEVVPVVTYFSDGTLISRDVGLGAVIMANDANLTLEYLDWNLNPLGTLPFGNSEVINQLRAIRVTVDVTSDRALSSGSTHTATVSQVVGLRNLKFLY